MRYADCWAGGLIAVVGIVAVAEAWPLQLWSEFGPGPGFFPVMLGLALVVMGAAVAIIALRDRKPALASLGDLRKPLIVTAVMAGYLVLLQVLGFLVATTLFLLTLIGWVESRPAWQALGLSIFITLGLYGLFDALLNIPLPIGVFAWIS